MKKILMYLILRPMLGDMMAMMFSFMGGGSSNMMMMLMMIGGLGGGSILPISSSSGAIGATSATGLPDMSTLLPLMLMSGTSNSGRRYYRRSSRPIIIRSYRRRY